MEENKTQTKILNFLKTQEEPLNLKELSKKTKISYPTILKHCDILQAKNKVTIKNYGNVRLIKMED